MQKKQETTIHANCCGTPELLEQQEIGENGTMPAYINALQKKNTFPKGLFSPARGQVKLYSFTLTELLVNVTCHVGVLYNRSSMLFTRGGVLKTDKNGQETDTGAARILWNKKDNDPQKIRRELFEKLFKEKASAVASYCDKVSQVIIGSGNYHTSITRDLAKSRKLYDGLTALESEVRQLGPLPAGREKYFVDVHRELCTIARDIFEAAQKEG